MNITYVVIFKISEVDDDSNFINMYLITNKEYYYPFDMLRILPSSNDISLWDNICTNELEKFKTKIIELCTFKNTTDFGVEVTLKKGNNNKNIFYLKLVDTIFLPFK